MLALPIGWEVLAIAAVVIILLFRPRAITDLAKSLGQVVAEFKKGRQQAEPDKELLAETAEKLGIRTEGKTPEQIREEILAKAGRP